MRASVFPDGPWRYWSTVFDDAYCQAHGLLGSGPADEPDVLSVPTEREVHRWTRCVNVTDPLAGLPADAPTGSTAGPPTDSPAGPPTDCPADPRTGSPASPPTDFPAGPPTDPSTDAPADPSTGPQAGTR
ncbi:hypothetical protein [Nonomuraea sp. NPDC005501]|uniref:hypothetical protein n=1 Tax=Nonomuraea sp. NPDC005501 TaxID=3156884 RepID=UPI00339F5FB3